MKKLIAIMMAAVIFSACKKENSCDGCINGNTPPVSVTNHSPVANAGNDNTIILPANTVNIDGSRSTDPDNNIASYQWTKIAGPTSFTITNANAVQTQLTNLTEGSYQFELKVTDAGGLFDRDTVQITVLSFNGSGGYIAGSGMNANGKMVARIWKEEVLQDLSDGQHNAGANSVYVAGSNVYVAGYDFGNSVAVRSNPAALWKNSVAQILSHNDGYYTYDNAKSVFVSGNDVYVAGVRNYDGYGENAVIWKNGIEQILSNDESKAGSVFVSGSDVYVAGATYGITAVDATLWKNGVAQILSNRQDNAFANSVYVSGSDIYVAGIDGGICSSDGSTWVLKGGNAILWKNGQATTLGKGTAKSVFVSGNDVYVVGEKEGSATLWKNGQATNLGPGIANAVLVSGSDVYVVGKKEGIATLWKNAVSVTLQGFTEVNSVFVQ